MNILPLASDHTILVSGTVIDYHTKEPIIGASVLSRELGIQTQTDIEGAFKLDAFIGATILVKYGKTASYIVEYGGEQTFELFKPASISTVGNQTILQQENFNKGNIHHPLQLIQSKVAGMLMSRGGGNNPFGQFHPNSSSIFTTVEPLIVVDGIPETDISILDPLSIQSIKVIKDGTAAKYGMRGASGVIEITTHRPTSSGIQYHTFLGVDRLHQTMPFLDAAGYKESPRGGVDFGADTDWFRAVSRTAYTQTHQLSLSKQHKEGAYRFSLLYKDAEGILKEQGYQRVQANGYFKQTALDGKLQVEALVRGHIQADNYSQPIAFRYAQSYNPTAPILDDNSPYDGYYELPVVDYFNPVAIIDQNPNEGERRQLFTKLATTYQFSPILALSGDYSADFYQREQSQVFGKNSLWIGASRNGLAIREQQTNNQYFASTQLAITPIASALKNLTIGHQYQIQNRQSLQVEGGDFLNTVLNFDGLEEARDFSNGVGSVASNQSKHRLSAFYGIADFNFSDRVLVQTGMRIEGSSRLGIEDQWARFPFLAITSRVGKPEGDFFWNNNFQLKASYGRTGNVPYEDNLSLRRYGRQGQFLYDGAYTDIYGIAYDDNPDLAWEQKQEWGLGLYAQPTLFNKSITFSIDYYQNQSIGILQTLRNRLGRSFIGNIAKLKNRGWEVALKMDILQNRNFYWQTALLAAATTSILDDYAQGRILFRDIPQQRLPYVPAAAGSFTVSSVILDDDSTIGELLFLEYEGISTEGKWQFSDTNNDGMLDDLRDKTIVGNGVPNWTLGWQNTVQFWNFKLDVFFRGAFGHDLFNQTRALTENPTILEPYNVLVTTFEGESARLTEAPIASSFYVENASFLRLDNLQLSYTLNAPKNLPFQFLQIYLAANNLFTLTNYQGWDPDYRLQSGNDVLAIGYEFRDVYLPTRSWVVGLQVAIK